MKQTDWQLQAARQRALLRQLVRDRGPDTGRWVDHLKLRSLGGRAESLLELYEQGGLADRAVDLTTRTGDVSRLLFMYDVDAYDGDAGYGG